MSDPPVIPTVSVRSAPCLSENRSGSEPRELVAGPTVSSTSTRASRATRSNTTTLEDYQCPICMDTFINVCETDCSHRFCNHCLATWFYQRRSQVCPSCRSNIRAVSQLPEMDARIERYVEQRFTDAQKAEREALKRSREASESFITGNRREPDSDDDDDQFGFEIEMLEFDPDRERRQGVYADFMAAVEEFDDYSRRSGVHVSTSLSAPGSSSVQTPFYLNANVRAHAMWVSPPSTAGIGEESEGPQDPESATHPSTFEVLEARLNSFELKLRETQVAYNQLMNFQLEHDNNGVFVRRIYDRFNALGLVEENQRHQWANLTPFDRRNTSRYTRTRNGTQARRSFYSTTTVHSSSTTANSRPNTRRPRNPLDATGWLTYFHHNRHDGSSESPGVFNGWESFINSNPPLDVTPASRAETHDSYTASNPQTPAWRRRANSRTDTRSFTSPNNFSCGYHSFLNSFHTESAPEPPETGDTLHFDPEISMNNLHFEHDTRTEEYDDESEAPNTGHTCGHRCQHHRCQRHMEESDHEYDADNNSVPPSGYQVQDDDSDEDDDEDAIQIQFVVRPSAPVRDATYSAESN